jgi:hypothetical protein
MRAIVCLVVMSYGVLGYVLMRLLVTLLREAYSCLEGVCSLLQMFKHTSRHCNV